MATPPLGYIEPHLRTQLQQDAHNAAMAKAVKFSLPPVTLAKGDRIMLTDFWKAPAVVTDIGAEFTGFGQYTGSCVGVSAGDAEATLSFIQRCLSTGATKAFIPWWPFAYGRTRYNEGDRGQGEGAVDSVMGETLNKEGSFEITQAGLPAFSKTGPDGWWLTKQLELQWSDGARIDPKWLTVAKQFTVQGMAPINTVADMVTSIANGYPILTGCSMYCGNGSIVGSGDTAYVRGKYDGSGGHSTCRLGAWNHPNDGLLIAYSNQWPTSTYPKDPAGLGRCCVWLPESEEDKMLNRYGGSGGETMALSHLNYFPAQPEVYDWIIAP